MNHYGNLVVYLRLNRIVPPRSARAIDERRVESQSSRDGRPRGAAGVLPAGVIPQRVNLERQIMTGTPRVAPATVLASVTRLRRIIELEQATVIFHHDAEQWKTLRLAPEFYD
jgi:hypothetical protein